MRARAAGLLAAALVTLAGCNAPTGGPNGTAGPGANLWAPQTAWERALGNIDADGYYSKDAALTLFATAYGPLPGVAAKQDQTGIFSRTIAIRAVSRVEDQLTQEQRDAITAYLTPPDDATTVEIPPVAQISPMRLVSVSSAIEDALRAVAEDVRLDIAAKMGGDFDGWMKVTFVPRPADVQPVEGQYPNGGTSPEYLFDTFVGCHIEIFNEVTVQSGVQLTALMTHEVFHCFQDAIEKTRANHDAAKRWIAEGQATWVGLELGGPSQNYQRFWDKYLLMPQLSLDSRDYDAVGFYAHLAESGIDPWSVFRPMLEVSGNTLLAYLAAGADAEGFVDSWASSVVRQGGPAWNTSGPGITASHYTPLSSKVSKDSSINLSQPFFTNSVTTYDLDTDIVKIDVDGHARLRAGALDQPVHGSMTYCVEGHDCSKTCPGQPEKPPLPTIAASMTLALSGGSEGLVGKITATAVDDVKCETPEPTDDQFCVKYRDYVAWTQSLGPDPDITQALAAEVAYRFDDMYPVAPSQLKDYVALVWAIYSTFAEISEPVNIPATGQVGGISKLPDALMAMHAYCGIPWPAS
jgi:hypothetical protein